MQLAAALTAQAQGQVDDARDDGFHEERHHDAGDDEWPAMQPDEDGMLDFAATPRQANSRLACQITLTDALDGLVVDLPATQY